MEEKLIKEIRDHLDVNLPNASTELRKIAVKEYLQPYILYYIYNSKKYKQLNFYGGTCLRFIYGLNRFSEDLDFDNSEKVDISELSADLTNFFKSETAYTNISTRVQQGERGVVRIILKFPILKALGLAPLERENLHLKVEISQHKQLYVSQTTPVFKYGKSFVVNHFSLETLMAGKMLACLKRTFKKGSEDIFIKGRDFYDLLWLMQKKVLPYKPKLEEESSCKDPFSDIASKVVTIKKRDLESDLLALFENREYIETWIENFHDNFERFLQFYKGF
jgi:predicted nucleotidyltransferase component of viral defense system